MHPLSWNVYGGHTENVELLLKHGANVNADFDSMNNQGSVTAMDIALQLKTNEDGDERFVQMESILRKYGGKTIKEIQGESDSPEEVETEDDPKEADLMMTILCQHFNQKKKKQAHTMTTMTTSQMKVMTTVSW